MGSDIFLSYSRADADLAKKFVEAASGRGIDVWFDEKIQGGDDWRQTIVEALGSAKALVILFSEHSNASTELIKELAIADKMRKRVVPVLIADTEPTGAYLYEMGSRNWINICPNPETRLDRLADTLATQLGLHGGATSPAPNVGIATNPPTRKDVSRPVELLGLDAPANVPDKRLSGSNPLLAPEIAPTSFPPPGEASTRETPVALRALTGERDQVGWFPLKRYDPYILAPILAISILFTVLHTASGFYGRELSGVDLSKVGVFGSFVVFTAYIIVISVRNAQLNRGIFSKESFAGYVVVGFISMSPFVTFAIDSILRGEKRFDWEFFLVNGIFFGGIVLVAVLANVLQVILRKTFMRDAFRSRIAQPLAP